MNKNLIAGIVALATITSCTMQNPLLGESPLEYGAPRFNEIQNKHYLPAFKKSLKEAKAEIDAIVNNPEAPTFQNTIEALEYSGANLNQVSGIFYNILEANTDDELQAIAEEISPMMTEFSMYVSLNPGLFERVKAVYNGKDTLSLDKDQLKILENSYKGFVRGGANLNDEDKATYSKLSEELSLLSLKFNKNALAANNAYTLNIKDSCDLAGLPDYVIDMGAQAAKDKGLEGWVFDLSYPSYGPFMKFSTRRNLRKELYMAYNTKAFGGEFDNTGVVKDIVDHRIKIANILGYATWADYELEERMVKTPAEVEAFIGKLLKPSLPAAREEVLKIYNYAVDNGFEDDALQPWDFSFWSEKYKAATYTISETELKPYFQLDNCIDAVLGLATTLYGITFEPIDLPVYHKDVKVFDVKDENGKHLALFYADFFPRESKRSGAWMTEFRGQSIRNGVERRPFISIVTNFSKPTESAPSLLTHDELTTFLHEFGHAIHGMMAEGRYGSIAGTNVARDFVELPSQIMENWAYEPAYLEGFARHYQSGEVIPTELIEKIVAAKNYLAAYGQVRQLQFGILDMAWHTLKDVPAAETVTYEKAALAASNVLPSLPNTCISASFGHIFSGGYSAGYYSYKWAEVLEADAYSLFQEKGIFNRSVAKSFRDNILSKGSSDDEAVLYRNFRGHNPEPDALLKKLGIIK